MDICYTGDAFRNQSRGGVSRYFCEIATRIDDYDGANTFINAPIHFNLHLKDANFRRNNHYFPYSTQRFGFNRRVTQISKRIEKARFHRQSFDLVHFTSLKNYEWGFKEEKVVTIFDLIREKEDRTGEKFRLLASILKEQKKVITISQSVKREILENFKILEDSVHVTYLGVSNNFSEHYKSLTLLEGIPYILFVGQRRGYKNFNRLLEAFAMGNELRNNFMIIAAGGGSFSTQEKLLIEKLGLTRNVVQVTATESKLGELYRGASAFIFPSLAEGFGLPLIEAIYAGTRIACSDIPVFREIGLEVPNYFDPLSVHSIYLSLLKTLKSQQIEVAQFHEMAQLSRFSWDKCALDTYCIYRKITS